MSNFGEIPPGTLNISSSDFVKNSAVGFAAYGGAIEVDAEIEVAVTSSLFGDNNATGDDYAGGYAAWIWKSLGRGKGYDRSW